MGIRKRLVLKAEDDARVAECNKDGGKQAFDQKQNKITASRVLTSVILSSAVRVKDKI